MVDLENKIENYRKWAIRLAISGFVILFLFLLLLGLSGMLFGQKLNPNYTVMVGTFIGGTIGAIWTLTGVLLYYAALMYQREQTHVAKVAHEDLNRAYEHQKLEAEINQFQMLYFQLFSQLQNFRDALNSYDIIEEKKTHLDVISKIIWDAISAETEQNGEYNPQYAKTAINNLLPKYKGLLSSFCETFFFIALKCINDKKDYKTQYMTLLVDTLPDHELTIVKTYGNYYSPERHISVLENEVFTERFDRAVKDLDILQKILSGQIKFSKGKE